MTDRFPNFKYVPALADYMLTVIDRQYDCDTDSLTCKVKVDAPGEVHDAFRSLRGTQKERYDILLELSDAANTDDGVETYIDEIGAPTYNKDLLGWLCEGDHIFDVEDALKEYGGDCGLIGAIAIAWCNVRANELRDAATVLEEYLNCGDEGDSENV